MNIISALRSIQEFHMTLSEQDVAQLLNDPCAFGERLADQFKALAAPTAIGGGVSVSTNGHTPKRQGAHRKGAKSGRKRKTAVDLVCAECGEVFKAKGWLDRHMLKVHDKLSAASPAV